MVARTVDPFDYTSAEALIEHELIAVGVATAHFQEALALLTRHLLVVWPGDDAPLEAKKAALAQLPFDRLLSTVTGLDTAMYAAVASAVAMGIHTALAQAQTADFASDLDFDSLEIANAVLEGQREINGVDVGARTKALAKTIYEVAKEQILAAKLLLRNVETMQEAQTVVGVANRATTRIEAVVRTEVHESANLGTLSVVDSSRRLVSIWRAERNACVHCLAYSGQINDGDGYPGGLTYGKKALTNQRVKKPPLHPNCRCDQITATVEGATAISKALDREAQRSILRGFSLESESNGARIDAAQRLLNRGTPLARSVRQYAARAVRLGEFPRGRDLPQL